MASEHAAQQTPSAHTPSARTAPPAGPSGPARFTAELIGTFILVFGGVGTALLASKFPYAGEVNALGVGFLGVALAFGISVVASVYAFGHISGGHFNPAVTLGLFAAGRFPGREILPYVVAQIIGGVLASSALAAIALGGPEGLFMSLRADGFASNGYAEASPGGFGLGAAALTEVVLTAVFLFVILGVTDRHANPVPAGLAIGVTLTLIHLVSIPVTNTSVNPARSIAAAVYGGALPLGQLWLFVLAPLVGGVLAALVYRGVLARRG